MPGSAGAPLVSLMAAGFRAARRTPGGRAGLAFLFFLVLLALFGPLLLPDPFHQFDLLEASNTAPGPDHPFGTDQLSRDVLSRVVSGARISLAVAALAVALSVTLGAGIGLVAGYWGGPVDATLMRLVDGALAIPRLFLLLLVLSVPERVPLFALILLIGATGWFTTGRVVRAETLRLREETFVRAAEALGASRRRIIFRHLLVNTAGPLLVAATLGVGDVILLEAGLSYLGLGVQPPTPSWGGMIMDARPVLEAAPWVGIFPGLAITLTVLATNLVGDALREALDPRGA
ncbi:MAG TPA: ABC transporter permease [Gemmatimonadales bacterium]|nr:ABC transporter permease [Gemmatimonadales bacterium]